MSSERVLQKDLYGFPISVAKEEQAERVKCFKKSKKRQARDWAFETTHRHIPASVSHEDMKRRCRKGIPTELRSFVWMQISGASQKKSQYASSYFVSTATAQVEGEAHEGHLKQIDLDVPRTFPEHAFFKSHQDKLVPGTYDSGISGCLREVRVLEGLLQRKMPAVSKHLRKQDVDLIAVVPQWFLSLFSQDFPFETAVRVFDALLFEGSKILHRVALAMFKLTEPRLLQATDTMAAALSLRSAALRMHDRDLIMRTAVRRIGPLSQATIDKLRASQQPESVLSAFLSRITARKPAKKAPWQSMGTPGMVYDDLEGDNAQESMIGTAKNAAARSDIGMPPRRHSSSGLRTMQHNNPINRRSMDAPAPIDLLASMGGVGVLDTALDASSVATSPRSVQHAQTACTSSADSHDPRTAQFMQVQAVLDQASRSREQEFTHTEAFNFTRVKVVKVSEAAKLSVRSPLDGSGNDEEDAHEGASAPAVLGAFTGASSSSGGTLSYMQAPHARVQSLPMEGRFSDGAGGSWGIGNAQNTQRTLNMHGDVRMFLAAADERAERAASGYMRSSVLQDRSSEGTGGTTGTEGSPMTFKLPYPPTHVCGGANSDTFEDSEEGAGLRALLREAAGSGRTETVSDRSVHAYGSEAVAEAVAAGPSAIRPAIHRPVAVNAQAANGRAMGGHNSFVPAIAEEASIGRAMADLQFASGFQLDFRDFHGADNQQVGGYNPNIHLPPHGQVQEPRTIDSAPSLWNQRQQPSGTPEVSGAQPADAQIWQWGVKDQQNAQQPTSQHSEAAIHRVSPGSYPSSSEQTPGQMLQPPRSVHEMINAGGGSGGLPPPVSTSAMFSIAEELEDESSAESQAASARKRGSSPTRPHNAYSGMYPQPLAGGSAAVPVRQLPGSLSPGVVHGLMPIEALGVPGMQPHTPPPDPSTPEMPVLPEGGAVNHITRTFGGHWPSTVNMPSLPSSTRMGKFVDGVFSQGTQPPASGLSDMWYTAHEFPPDLSGEAAGSGSGSHSSSRASSQPGTCGFPLRLCN